MAREMVGASTDRPLHRALGLVPPYDGTSLAARPRIKNGEPRMDTKGIAVVVAIIILVLAGFWYFGTKPASMTSSTPTPPAATTPAATPPATPPGTPPTPKAP